MQSERIFSYWIVTVLLAVSENLFKYSLNDLECVFKISEGHKCLRMGDEHINKAQCNTICKKSLEDDISKMNVMLSRNLSSFLMSPLYDNI